MRRRGGAALVIQSKQGKQGPVEEAAYRAPVYTSMLEAVNAHAGLKTSVVVRGHGRPKRPIGIDLLFRHACVAGLQGLAW